MADAVDLRDYVRARFAGASQGEIAIKLGISPAMISQMLNGKRRPSATVLSKLGLRKTTAYEIACEPMSPDEEGWSEWIHPLPGYLMQCCDCGLVHEMQFQIGTREGDGPLNAGESEEAVVLFRARRFTEEPK